MRTRPDSVAAVATFIGHDVPAAALEGQGTDLARADVVIRVASVLQGIRSVDIGMMDDHQRATGCQQVQ